MHKNLQQETARGENNVLKTIDFGMSQEGGGIHIHVELKHVPMKWTASEVQV